MAIAMNTIIVGVKMPDVNFIQGCLLICKQWPRWLNRGGLEGDFEVKPRS